jgi:hypothetical protein
MGENTMKRAIFVLGIIFAVTLAIVIGNRLSVDAMAVLVGVACGVLAGVPTSLLLVWALTRRSANSAQPVEQARMPATHQYPPVVVVNPGAGQVRSAWNSLPAYPAGNEMLPPPEPRSFKVVGETEPGSNEWNPAWAPQPGEANISYY